LQLSALRGTNHEELTGSSEDVPEDREIIFGPDMYLGGWAAGLTKRKLHLWNGYCPTHQRIMPGEIAALRKKYPGAVVMVHPEVNPSIAAEADVLLGTGGMIRFAGGSAAGTFIVGTEVGMIYRLSKLYPDKLFVPASANAVCPNMKKITLEKLARSLETIEPVVRVPEDVATASRSAIRRMTEIG